MLALNSFEAVCLWLAHLCPIRGSKLHFLSWWPHAEWHSSTASSFYSVRQFTQTQNTPTAPRVYTVCRIWNACYLFSRAMSALPVQSTKLYCHICFSIWHRRRQTKGNNSLATHQALIAQLSNNTGINGVTRDSRIIRHQRETPSSGRISVCAFHNVRSAINLKPEKLGAFLALEQCGDQRGRLWQLTTGFPWPEHQRRLTPVAGDYR